MFKSMNVPWPVFVKSGGNMNYREKLLKIRALKPTEEMVAVAREKRKRSSNMGLSKEPQNYIFYRSCLEDGILKISLFLSEELNIGKYTPIYDVFLDYEKRRDLVYDCRNQKWKRSILYNLSFPENTSYVKEYAEEYTYEDYRDQIQEYVFRERSPLCAQDTWDSIVHFQEENRETARLRKEEKLSARINRKMELVPALPGDWEKWVEKVGADKNYIFYDSGKNVRTGYCTYCEREVPIIKPRYNKAGRCSRCKKKVQYKSNGKRGTVFNKYEVYLIQKCGEGFVLRCFNVQKRYTMRNNAPDINCLERRRLFYSSDFTMEEYHYGWENWCMKWKKGRLRVGGLLFSHPIEYPEGRIYGKTIPSLSKHFFRHTGFIEFFRKEKSFCPEKYFETYVDMPSLEQLVKADLLGIVRDVLKGKSIALDETKTDLLGKLQINHAQLSRLRNGDCVERLKWLRYENETGKSLDDELISWYIMRNMGPNTISFIKDRMSEIQVKNYLSRQAIENEEQVKDILRIWRDYLHMAEKLGWDTQDAIIYRARKLIQRHEEATRCLRRKGLKALTAEKEAAFPTIRQIYNSIRKKYEYCDEKETYAVLVPSGIEDLLEEGKCLNHCIDVNDIYLNRIADRETYIMFLRKRENPLQPYYTLEVEPNGTVRQKRTYYNRQENDIDEINKFLKRWQKIIAKRLSDQDELWAKESKKKREEEFFKLRREEKMIFAGNYKGRLLADILKEDLMEVDEENPAA